MRDAGCGMQDAIAFSILHSPPAAVAEASINLSLKLNEADGVAIRIGDFSGPANALNLATPAFDLTSAGWRLG